MLEELEVTCITIDLPFRLNHVNCFMARGENGWTIMDAGLNNSVAENTWKPLIANRDITDMIISHYHPDHYGFSGRLQELTGANVFMTEVDKNTVLNIWDPSKINFLKENYRKCGMSDEIANSLAGNEAGFTSLVNPHPRVERYLQEGDKLVFGKYEYEIVKAPGHSDGLICLYNKEKSVLFSTDHILPKITPNISYHFLGDKNPLHSYFQSLKKFKRFDVEYIIPSHGKPFTNANKRIDEIILHHEERLSKLVGLLGTPSTVYEICHKLFGRNFNAHEMKFAIGETIAHLEYLVNRGECIMEQTDGVYFYEAS
jgi:glyoxylase-like metal-dependent hydrolase (beta-lactamase superfamily II)